MIMSNQHILEFYENMNMTFLNRDDVSMTTCIQTAGDVVIVPECWGHGVLNLQDTVATAVEVRNNLWRSRHGPPMILNMLPRNPRPKVKLLNKKVK